MNLKDVLTAQFKIAEIPVDEYRSVANYIKTAEAFSRNMYRPIIIVDLYRKKQIYRSGNFSFFVGRSYEESKKNAYQFYLDAIPENELKEIVTVLRKTHELFLSFPIEERSNLILSYYFHVISDGKKRLICQNITPLALTDKGELWLILCTFSLSSRKLPGNFIVKRHNDPDYFQYRPDKGVWYHKEGIMLTSVEKDILLLSSQGYTMKEIAVAFGKSQDMIKAYKRVLFSKLRVSSITEAVFTAVNYSLL